MTAISPPTEASPKLLFTVELPRADFLATVHERERWANAGSTTHQDKYTGWTVWSIAHTWVGLSEPGTALAVVALTEDQHRLLVRALAEGMPPAELPDHLWQMAQVCGFDSKPLSLLGGSAASLVHALGAVAGPTGARLPVGTRVRWTSRYLASVAPPAARRLANRVGTVRGYRLGAQDPIVDLPAVGRRTAIRLFEVSLNGLQVLA